MTERYKKEKRSILEYAKTRQGRIALRKANIKYRRSLRGLVLKKLWNKGLSILEQQKVFEAFGKFNGKCQCCGTRKHGGKGWHLDHKDGKFRGILCHHCNVAAAFLKDSIEITRKMLKYLRRFYE